MSAERVERSAYLKTSLSRDDVRGILTKYGKIRGLYTVEDTSDAPQLRYFVEFSDARAVHRTLASAPTGMVVCALGSSASLVDQFHSVACTDISDQHGASCSPSQSGRPARVNARTQYRPKSAYTTLGEASPTTPMSHSRRHYNYRLRTTGYTQTSPEREYNKEIHNNPLQPSPQDVMEHSNMDTAARPDHRYPPLYTPALWPELPTQRLGVPPAEFSLGLDTCIYLSYGGHTFPVSLDGLDESPEEAISLLTTAAASPLECAKWMIVGAHYRARGNPPAAVAVITVMVEVMTGAGMDQSQLKPAMLMLSSCHFDIAKRLRAQAGAETKESKSHFDLAYEYLRNVYGTFVPPLSTAQNNQHPACPSSMTCVTALPEVNGPSTPKAKRVNNTRLSPKPTLRYSRVKIPEREIQSLRDRQADQSENLDRARVAKRKFEEDLEAERHVRRRLEQKLDSAEREVEDAKEGAEFALEQCHLETAIRPQTEQRAEETHQESMSARAAMEPKVAEHAEWDRRIKDFFGKLGVMFLKAARGDLGEVLNGRA
ncbi:hypothetical protein C8Q78DRAFT_1010282 [Trametes maxima]|nr:hypothetical protein C8Q78DRAFT_1010282 [Trametes maxima]